jgi:hypothetical protein
MPAFTVHEPPLRKNEMTTDPTRLVFVRDGFYFWAFLLAPLWMLRHRLWLVLLLYVIATVAAQAVFLMLGIAASAMIVVGLLLSLLVGLEAASLRRWTLGRRHWNTIGLVVAPDLESAERRFFDSWEADAPAAAPSHAGDSVVSNAIPAQPVHRPPSTPTVIGLFPEPQSRP